MVATGIAARKAAVCQGVLGRYCLGLRHDKIVLRHCFSWIGGGALPQDFQLAQQAPRDHFRGLAFARLEAVLRR
eukprot:5570996-Lingulodinium_polyedra.AAC.1